MTSAHVPGLTRTDLQRHDLSVPGREVIQNRVDISPDAPPVRHKHPGEEIIYVLEGTLEYSIDGRGLVRHARSFVPAEGGPRQVGLQRRPRARTAPIHPSVTQVRTQAPTPR